MRDLKKELDCVLVRDQARLWRAVKGLSDRDQEILRLYYKEGLLQDQIADRLETTQGAVSYRVKRLKQRLRFLMQLGDYTREAVKVQVQRLLPEHRLDYRRVLMAMWEKKCQSEAARSLGIGQGKLRYRFLEALKIMSQAARSSHQALGLLREFQLIYKAKDLMQDQEQCGKHNHLLSIKGRRVRRKKC